jgi:AraC-like DNA-binding protein
MFLAHVESLGMPIGDLVEGELDDTATLELPFPALVELCERVAERARDPFVGLSIADALPPGSYGIVEFVVAAAASVGDAVELLVKFQALASELAHTNVEHDPATKTVRFEHWIDHPAARYATQLNEFSLATYYRLGHVRLGFRPQFVAVHFMHEQPERRAELEAFFDAPIVFGAARNGLVIDAELLARPLSLTDPQLFAILSERAERDLSRVSPAPAVAGALAVAYRDLLVRTPHRAQVHDAACVLGLSVRSLNRRLGEEGTSFRAIEADVKRALADEYLEATSRPIDHVASVLGFATTSAFIRAYKRWTGRTPSRARVMAGIGNRLA